MSSRVRICVGTELELWLREPPPPRGQVLGGEAGVRLSRDPDSTVGIDVVYVSADVVVRQTGETSLIDGVPTLAVEILSPNDTVEDIHETRIPHWLMVSNDLVQRRAAWGDINLLTNDEGRLAAATAGSPIPQLGKNSRRL